MQQTRPKNEAAIASFFPCVPVVSNSHFYISNTAIVFFHRNGDVQKEARPDMLSHIFSLLGLFLEYHLAGSVKK